MNLRGIFTTDADGRYWFRSAKPSYYPIPDDGPVGKMLAALGRHPYRPAHIHFIVGADGFQPITTHYLRRRRPLPRERRGVRREGEPDRGVQEVRTRRRSTANGFDGRTGRRSAISCCRGREGEGKPASNNLHGSRCGSSLYGARRASIALMASPSNHEAAWRNRLNSAIGETQRPADLPTCGGDVRQDRGGREGTRPLRSKPVVQLGASCPIPRRFITSTTGRRRWPLRRHWLVDELLHQSPELGRRRVTGDNLVITDACQS